MKLKIDKDRPHVIRDESGSVVAVLVDYPLARHKIGKRIVEGFNRLKKEENNVC